MDVHVSNVSTCMGLSEKLVAGILTLVNMSHSVGGLGGDFIPQVVISADFCQINRTKGERAPELGAACLALPR